MFFDQTLHSVQMQINEACSIYVLALRKICKNLRKAAQAGKCGCKELASLARTLQTIKPRLAARFEALCIHIPDTEAITLKPS